MFVEFFIRRPIFASVCSLIIVLLGAISIPGLPIEQYPNLALPQVTVSSAYIGASAETVETAVTRPLEEAINGVEGMKYITSSSTNDGVSTITVTFEPTRDIDVAAVDVQNRVSTATGQLPSEVNQTGITITKNTSSFVMAMALYGEGNQYDQEFISNYADLYLVDALKRVPGVGDVRIFGARRFAMRIWLDPLKLAASGLTASDVVNALREQNVQVAAGQVGQPPAPRGQGYQLSLRAEGRLTQPKEFDDIILKTGANGALVRVRDVGHAELGAEDYSGTNRFDGHTGVGLGIMQLPGANALDVANNVKAELARLSKTFPPGLKYETAFDTTLAVSESIREVLITLAEAIVLVILVIFVFLQRGRATLIPAVTIPVSLIGTFAFVKLFGFSLNTLTLFGLTLATGLVVDDAIVVIENIERQLEERHAEPHEAARVGMMEVFSAVIATSLVLIAVFVPVAFFPGTTGTIYRQFSLTIAASIAISAFNSVTLTPALSALLIRERGDKKAAAFRAFDRGFNAVRRGYARALTFLMRWRWAVVGVFAVLLAATYVLFQKAPSGFVPEEDQGYFIVSIQGPEGASLQRTDQVLDQAAAILRQQPEIQHIFAIGGFSFTGSGSNNGLIFINLKPWSEREGKAHSAAGIIERIRGPLMGIPGALVLPFPPPAVRGIGSFGGFQFEILDEGAETPLSDLANTTGQLVGQANQQPQLRGVFSGFTANTPQLSVTVDRERAKALGISLTDIFNALQVFMGSQYVNNFDYGTRTYRVYVQAAPQYRANPAQIGSFYVRAANGQMVPLESVVKITPGTTAQVINHYNLFRSAELNGSPAPGYSSGDAIQSMEALAQRTLPNGFGYSWSGLSLEQLQSGSKTLILFGLGLLIVFLVLAAQYESFTLPFIIILAVPLALLGALGLVLLRGLVNDVFAQVGLLMLIGLASKNAILIVEFARDRREAGHPIVESAIEAAETRLRPILMTSLAFLLGVVPLMITTGAGAAARHSLGTAVFGGMLVSTVLNLFVIPCLYVIIETIRERARRPQLPQPRRPVPA